MVPSATHRTILLVDVEKFSDHGRTDSQRRRMHSGLYDLLQDAFEAAGIGWDSCYREDRGDGAMILAPADIPKARFSDQLPYRLARTLRDYNRMHPAGERIRLRMALHAGEVILDGRGAVSSAVNTAFRLLETAPLKEALRNAAGRPLALIVSSWFYFEVIRNSAEFCPAAYSPVSADVKETSTIAWITIPGPRGPVRRRARSEPWRVRVRDPGGAIHGPGILVAGRYVITAAGTLGSPRPAAACPPGRVLFDVPAKPAAGLQRAETIFWCPASPSGGTPGLGVAGLSIAGPAIRGVDEPPLLFNLGLGARIVRLHAGASAGAVQGKLPLWARLPERGGNGGELIPLSPLAAEAPDVTRVCNGSDVVDEQTGEVLGLAVTDAPAAGEGRAWLTPIGGIADKWPLLRRIATAGTCDLRDEDRPRAFRSADIVPLVERSLEIPALANAQSRHLIVSELPLQVTLSMPRSSTDRADLTALIWSCAHVPAALIELASKIRESSPGGKKADDLAKDLERLHA